MDRNAARLTVLDELIDYLRGYDADDVWSWRDPEDGVPPADQAELDTAAGWLVRQLEGQRAKLGER